MQQLTGLYVIKVMYRISYLTNLGLKEQNYQIPYNYFIYF